MRPVVIGVIKIKALIISIPCPSIDAGQGRISWKVLRMLIPFNPGSTWDSPEQLWLPGLSTRIYYLFLSFQEQHRRGLCWAYRTVPSRVLTGLGAAIPFQTHGFWSMDKEFSLTCVHRLWFGIFPLCGTMALKVFVTEILNYGNLMDE